MRTIYLDMDGTIANLYKDTEWLTKLEHFNTEPYENAEPMVDEKILLNLIENGYELGIITWLAGYHNNKEYDKAVRKVKKEWLKKHYPNIRFTEMHIVKYGTPKWTVAKNKNGILVDDEKPNRDNWKGIAIEPKEIYKI